MVSHFFEKQREFIHQTSLYHKLFCCLTKMQNMCIMSNREFSQHLMEIAMAAVFILCTREGASGLEVLLGQKHNGRILERGLTVPAGGMEKRDNGSRHDAAIRELFEEAGVLLNTDRLEEFRIEGGDWWYHARLRSDEVPSEDPELNPQTGKPVWGPAQFYPANKLPENIARWQTKKLNKALAHVLPE